MGWLLFTVCFASNLFAGQLFVEGGAYFASVQKRIAAQPHYQSDIAFTSPYLKLGVGFPLSPKVSFAPAFLLLVPWRSTTDSDGKLFRGEWDLDLLWKSLSFLWMRIGPGLQIDYALYSHKAVVLNNGTDRATFYSPGGTAFTYQVLLHFGFLLPVSQNWRLVADLSTVSLFYSPRRQWNAHFGLEVQL